MSKQLIVIVTAASYAFSLFIGYDLANRYLWTEWNETKAIDPMPHVESRLHNNNRTYITCIEYEYAVERSTFPGRECGIHNSFGSKIEAERAIEKYLENNSETEFIVRYEKLEPSESYLVCNQKLARALKGLYISTSAAVISTLYWIYFILKRRQIKSR